MNQDDILRELELLPVWQSRQPAVAMPAVAAPEVDESIETTPAAHVFRCIVSTDAQWAFVLAPQANQAAETLLQNMLKAVQVNVKLDDATSDIHQYAPQVIVAMGETVAQQLLETTQSLAQLRGETHALQQTPVIVTFSPNDLLENAGDKAKAWEDLCLAKFTIANL